MTTIWFDNFKKQILKLTGHTLSSIEEESFARCENVIVQSLVCFTNIFVQEVRKRLTQKYLEDMNEKFKKFLRLIKNSISDCFRKALIPSISTNGVPISLSRFAVLLNKNIRQRQKSSQLKFLPDYRIIHAFKLEEAIKGINIVQAGFAFDCEPQGEEDWAFFDLKITNFEKISTKFVSNGKVYADLLQLDSLEVFNQYCENKSAYTETHV